ncbi:PIR protein [Plasmodium ovale]|uniref:PIR protein n=1 Tax=Plasmodium ovale TaxID=36330 RepID=A0A1C3KGN0_PLAOA|nr:PIR protein [Plasmodium ovale]
MTTVKKGDIPSNKHFEKLKKSIKFDDIIRYIKKVGNSSMIEGWINTYSGYLENYLKDNVDEWKKSDTKKRCDDLNYILDIIVDSLEQIKLDNSIRYIHDINTYSRGILNKYGSLNCYRNMHGNFNRIEYFKKRFSLLCDDVDYVITNIDSINKSPDCNTIISDIFTRKNKLLDVLNKTKPQHRSIFNFNKKCKNKIKQIFIKRDCNLVRARAHTAQDGGAIRIEENALPEGKMNSLENSQSEERLDRVQGEEEDALELSDPGSMELLQRELEEMEMSPHTKTSVAAGTFVGVSLISLFLYKTTPIGSWLRSRVMSSTENNYSMFNEETDNSLSNGIDPLQLNMDNYEYQMSYHAEVGL